METHDTDKQQIKQLLDNWAGAIRANDIPGILAHHSSDILMFDVVEPFQSKGLDAYRATWEDTFFPWYRNGAVLKWTSLKSQPARMLLSAMASFIAVAMVMAKKKAIKYA